MDRFLEDRKSSNALAWLVVLGNPSKIKPEESAYFFKVEVKPLLKPER